MRPDNSGNNSFPSGHTSTAFMMATWLHKEYGLTESPLYSILGYSVASSIAISRVINNKHWLSDVITGAGVGILSSELGYYFGDLIYGQKGISPMVLSQRLPPIDTKPSFINLSSGYSVLNNTIELNESSNIIVNTGFYIGVEGAYFFTPYWGVGGKIGVRTHSLNLKLKSLEALYPNAGNDITEILPGYMAGYSFQAGGYFSYPVSRRFSLGAKMIGGYYISSTSEVMLVPKSDESKEFVGFKSERDHGVGVEFGTSATTLISRNMGLRFFADYSITSSRPRYAIINSIENTIPTYKRFVHSSDATQNIVLGLGINAYFGR